jgi:hypothetical protein
LAAIAAAADTAVVVIAVVAAAIVAVAVASDVAPSRAGNQPVLQNQQDSAGLLVNPVNPATLFSRGAQQHASYRIYKGI